MDIRFESREGTQVLAAEKSESSIMKAVGEQLLKIAIPNRINVSTDYGDLHFDVRQRGTYKQDGKTYPSMYVTEVSNHLTLPHDTYPECYLTCIHPESNNYKFYHLIPSGDELDAEYGRIGADNTGFFGIKHLQDPYPLHLYWIRYYEKLSKGYTDQSEAYLAAPIIKPAHVPTEKPLVKEDGSVAAKLYKKLIGFAKHAVEHSLVSNVVTEVQVKKAKAILDELYAETEVSGFNKKLEELLVLSPRKESDVMSLLAKKPDDFSQIIDREENLLMAMEGLSHKEPVKEDASIFGDVEVYEATPEQKAKALKSLSPQLLPKVANVYRVIPRRQQEAFNAYLLENGITEIKSLWHGSRNENWLSIVQNSLSLHPNAVITGKMFGNGIYFAPSSMKSWGYTSYMGTRWAMGNSSTAFMGLYATAYGNPELADSARIYTKESLKAGHKDCVHAKAGRCLLNDEIVFYDERAVVLNYLVEFKS